MRKMLLCAMITFAAAGCGGCEDEPDPSTDAGDEDVASPDAGRDTGEPDDAAGDDAGSDMATPDAGPTVQLGDPVQLDVSEWTADAPNPDGTARVFQATDREELVESPFQNPQVGDWILENDVIRVVVEQDDRVITSCPYGGHIIAGEALDAEGGSILGEACLFFNGGSTVVGTDFEIVAPGGEGEAAVLAVTGTMEILDFINFPTMAEDFGLGPLGNLAVGPNRIPPLTATTYYILRPGDRSVRAVTAFRNDGDDVEHVIPMIAMPTGGDGYWFNPLNGVGGWGYESFSINALGGAPAPFVAFAGEESSFALIPEPVPNFVETVPFGGVYLGLSGLAFVALQVDDLLPALVANSQNLPQIRQIIHLPAGDTHVLNVAFAFGDGSLDSVVSHAYDFIGAETGKVEGLVVDASGEPVEGAIVTALNADSLPMNQARTEADGSFALTLPTGDYTLRTRLDYIPGAEEPAVTVTTGGEVAAGTIMLAEPGRIRVNVAQPDGSPTPARISVICVTDPCPGKITPQETNVTVEEMPENWAAVEWSLGEEVVLDLFPADYRVVVSRGIEWSVWPPDATSTEGELVSLTAGAEVVLDAEIARVVDTPDALGSDFHVHAIASHDSTTPHEDRVKSFVVEGVDVLVASDHDAIADFGPAVSALGVEDEIASLVGLEVTTSDIGHFNAFPLEYDPLHRRGGAVDWAGGAGPSLTPQQLFDALDENPGEQVIQVNHAAGLGLVEGLQANVLTGISTADPVKMRLPATEPDPDTGDTGLWTDDFTAFEVFNGLKLYNLWPLMRWWQTMIGRGFTPTGTAVTDTHRRFGQLGGVPRSYVFVDSGDTPATLDTDAFVAAINGGRLIGTSGPYFIATLSNDVGDTVGLGETLDGSAGSVTATLQIQTPAWIDVEAVDVYVNQALAITDTAEVIEDPLPPTDTHPVTMTTVDVSTGALVHQRREATVTFPIAVDADAYVVFVVRGTSTLYPVAVGDDEVPFAFSNPIFVDFDGNGYDNPPFTP